MTTMKKGQDGGGSRKTPFQLQALEKFYSETRHPTQKKMKECAVSLGLMCEQVRLWFKDRRRKDSFKPRDGRRLVEAMDRIKAKKKRQVKTTLGTRNVLQCGGSLARVQRLFPQDYILEKVFRKDGPSLGVEFDPLPERPFGYNKCPQPSQINKVVSRKRKEKEPCTVTMGYGMGKGLMSVWHATHPHSQITQSVPSLVENAVKMKLASVLGPVKTSSRRTKRQHQNQKQKTTSKKLQKRHTILNKKKVVYTKDKNQQGTHLSSCELAADDLRFQELDTAAVLLDDEELELSELQAGPNPLRCSAHLASKGRNDCPFCKDMLSRFPPVYLQMKHPFCTQPWMSQEIVKKLFKVFRFIYTHSIRLRICPFTLDEFAQAFHNKDSSLLGKIHVTLLKLLLYDTEREISRSFPRAFRNCRFIGFLHSLKQKNLDVLFWIQSLNSLTWVEILRQVLIAAGFGPKYYSSRKVIINKETTFMVKHGLKPHTLKGELFNLLSGHGSAGLKVSELSRASEVVSLSLTNKVGELEDLIYSTLSSDITLFEKIGPSSFRLRINDTLQNELFSSNSESGDSISSGDDYICFSSCIVSDDESYGKLDAPICVQNIIQDNNSYIKKSKCSIKDTEIDESYKGEVWLLGLMEGEYCNLSIEEKLDALAALVELTDSVLVSRIEESISIPSTSACNARDYGSGAKTKKILPSKGSSPSDTATAVEDDIDNFMMNDPDSVYDSCANLHPLQSIHLGYDRRYNSYWLFLGPCTSKDPGHRRIYFESSEDGHWEMIDSKQGLSSLLGALDKRGAREAHLLASLKKRETFLYDAMKDSMDLIPRSNHSRSSDSYETDVVSGEGSSAASDVDNNTFFEETTHSCIPTITSCKLGKKYDENKIKSEELQAFDKWIWYSFYNRLNAVKYNKQSLNESLTRCEICSDLYWRDEKHCRKCHVTFELDFDIEEKYAIHLATCPNTHCSASFPIHRVLSSQLQTLKAAIHAIEIAFPREAMVDAWTKSSHKLWGKRLRRTSSLAELFQVIADFVAALKEEWLDECSSASSSHTVDNIVVLFQSIPQTISAVALWMVNLDAQIAPYLKGRKENTAKERESELRI